MAVVKEVVRDSKEGITLSLNVGNSAAKAVLRTTVRTEVHLINSCFGEVEVLVF